MASFYTLQGPKRVGDSPFSVAWFGFCANHTWPGPIFDAYGPNYVIIPGSFGMVIALICFSFSEGMLPSNNILMNSF